MNSIYVFLSIFVRKVFMILQALVLINILLSWIKIQNRFTEVIYKLTEPLLEPFRKLLPSNIPLDFSPIILFFVLSILQSVILHIIYIICYWG